MLFFYGFSNAPGTCDLGSHYNHIIKNDANRYEIFIIHFQWNLLANGMKNLTLNYEDNN